MFLLAVGQGLTQTGGYLKPNKEPDAERIRVLRMGIDLGMTLVNTAELYGGGHAGELAGRAIKGIPDRVFLTSKFNPGNGTGKGLLGRSKEV